MLRLLDAVLPPGCAVCGVAVEPDPPICSLCAARVHPIPPPVCTRCGLTRAVPGHGTDTCSDCLSWPAALGRARSASLHRGPAADLVRGLKYRGWTALADYMGGLMVPAAHALGPANGPILVPVPLARSRLRERGFNQAELLARAVSHHVGWPVRPLLRRREGGGALAGLGREERARISSGAFEPARPVGTRGSPARRVVLVDDVVTTGATAAACAEALSRTGMGSVNVLSFARTDPLGSES